MKKFNLLVSWIFASALWSPLPLAEAKDFSCRPEARVGQTYNPFSSTFPTDRVSCEGAHVILPFLLTQSSGELSLNAPLTRAIKSAMDFGRQNSNGEIELSFLSGDEFPKPLDEKGSQVADRFIKSVSWKTSSSSGYVFNHWRRNLKYQGRTDALYDSGNEVCARVPLRTLLEATVGSKFCGDSTSIWNRSSCESIGPWTADRGRITREISKFVPETKPGRFDPPPPHMNIAQEVSCNALGGIQVIANLRASKPTILKVDAKQIWTFSSHGDYSCYNETYVPLDDGTFGAGLSSDHAAVLEKSVERRATKEAFIAKHAEKMEWLADNIWNRSEQILENPNKYTNAINGARAIDPTSDGASIERDARSSLESLPCFRAFAE